MWTLAGVVKMQSAKANLETASRRSDRQRAPPAEAKSMRQRAPSGIVQFVLHLIVRADAAVLCSGRQGQYCPMAARTM